MRFLSPGALVGHAWEKRVWKMGSCDGDVDASGTASPNGILAASGGDDRPRVMGVMPGIIRATTRRTLRLFCDGELVSGARWGLRGSATHGDVEPLLRLFVRQ